jgi:hypothetical protein
VDDAAGNEPFGAHIEHHLTDCDEARRHAANASVACRRATNLS